MNIVKDKNNRVGSDFATLLNISKIKPTDYESLFFFFKPNSMVASKSGWIHVKVLHRFFNRKGFNRMS